MYPTFYMYQKLILAYGWVTFHQLSMPPSLYMSHSSVGICADFNFIFLLVYDVEYFFRRLFVLLKSSLVQHISMSCAWHACIHICGYTFCGCYTYMWVCREQTWGSLTLKVLGVLCFILGMRARGLLQDFSLHTRCSFLDVDCILFGLEPSWGEHITDSW